MLFIPKLPLQPLALCVAISGPSPPSHPLESRVPAPAPALLSLGEWPSKSRQRFARESSWSSTVYAKMVPVWADCGELFFLPPLSLVGRLLRFGPHSSSPLPSILIATCADPPPGLTGSLRTIGHCAAVRLDRGSLSAGVDAGADSRQIPPCWSIAGLPSIVLSVSCQPLFRLRAPLPVTAPCSVPNSAPPLAFVSVPCV